MNTLRIQSLICAAGFLAFVVSSVVNAATVYVGLDGSGGLPTATGPVFATGTDAEGRAEANLLTGEFKAYAADPGPTSAWAEAGILGSDPLVFTNNGTTNQVYSFSMVVSGTYAISVPASSLSTSFIQAKTLGSGGTGGLTNSVRLQHRVSTSSPFNTLSDVTQGVGSYSVTTQALDAFAATLMLSNVVIAPGDSIQFSQYLIAQANTTSGVAVTDFENTATLALLVSNADFSVNTAGGIGSLSWVAVVPVPGSVWLLGSALGLLGWMRGKAT